MAFKKFKHLFYNLIFIFSVITVVISTPKSYASSQFAPEERITTYSSKIYIQLDGTLTVTEEIALVANQSKILHGIYRDFPTVYRNFKQTSVKGFKVIEVLKNGKPEPYFSQTEFNGVRIYIGNKETLIPSGVYTYTIKYQTTDQLGFFDEHDELYWNVTGNAWEFPIDKVISEVHIPAAIEKENIKTKSFIGEQDSKDSSEALSIITESNETVILATSNRPLNPNEGLTILIGWPKKIITPPPFYKNSTVSWIFGVQPLAGLGMATVVFLMLYTSWLKKGRDEGDYSTIPVQFEPPKGLTPSQIRLLNNMGVYDDKCFATGVINLAIKGYAKIEDKNGTYKVIRTNKGLPNEHSEESIIFSSFFPESQKEFDSYQLQKKYEVENNASINLIEKTFKKFVELVVKPEDEPGELTIGKKNSEILIDIQTKLRTYFEKLKKKYIVSNTKDLLKALLPILAFILVNVVYNLLNSPGNNVMIFLALIWITVVAVFALIIVNLWLKARQSKKISAIFSAILFSLFLTPFVIGGILLGGMAFSFVGMLSLYFCVALMIIAFFALPRRNKEATEIQIKIEGFKEFLTSQTEYIKGVQMDLPEKFSMYEKYPPFAIALDVEPQWSEKFKETIKEMSEFDKDKVNSWYIGNSLNVGSFSTNTSSFVSSFSHSISSASVNPSSSSGFSGGGGSSGGGGGGGGGGGW